MKRESISWLALLLNGVAILVFGLIVFAFPNDPEPYSRAIGAASIGMGLYGSAISVTAFRRRERWAWVVLWYYPLFWVAHLVGNLPPGQDHIHQIVFIVLSTFALLFATRDFLAPQATV